MNIFILDTDVKKNAQYHANTHVVKQVLEYCQLLSGACHLHGVAVEGMYKLTHKSHPSMKWTLESKQNFDYLLSLTEALLEEYTHRYGKVHASSRLIPLFKSVQNNIPKGCNKLTKFAIVVNKEVSNTQDAVTDYRKLYMTTKRDLCKWKNRNTPEWFV